MGASLGLELRSTVLYFVRSRIHNPGVKVVVKCSIRGCSGSTGSRLRNQWFGTNANAFFLLPHLFCHLMTFFLLPLYSFNLTCIKCTTF